jgi:hypothetical protein
LRKKIRPNNETLGAGEAPGKKSFLSENHALRGLKPMLKNKPVTAALKRCVTQKGQHSVFPHPLSCSLMAKFSTSRFTGDRPPPAIAGEKRAAHLQPVTIPSASVGRNLRAAQQIAQRLGFGTQFVGEIGAFFDHFLEAVFRFVGPIGGGFQGVIIGLPQVFPQLSPTLRSKQ